MQKRSDAATENANVATAVFEMLARDPETLFLCCEDEHLSRAAVAQMVADRQQQLLAAGLGEGNRVLVAGGRGNRFWIDLLALWGIAAVPVPLEPNVNAEHAAGIRVKAEPVALLRGSDEPPVELADLSALAECDGSRTAAETTVRPVSARDLALILFTSGTTGLPKGVMLSHGALLANARGTLEVLALTSDDRLFMAIPFRFVSALSHFLTVALRGAALMGTERRMLQSDFCTVLSASGASAFGGGPVQVRWLAEYAATRPLNLRWLMSSGDHLSPEIIGQVRERMPGTTIFVAYGLTEVGGRFCMLPPEHLDSVCGSVGRPIPGMDIAVLDERRQPVPTGEIGEVYAQGPCVFDGYSGDLEVTRQCLSDDGFKTGDQGYSDGDGWLFLRGRSDNVFKSAGIKVSTLPIADALMAVDCFADVAVVPAEDPALGKVPVCYYVMKDGSQFDKGSVLRSLRGTLPASHFPREFLPLPSIPRTASGKVDRRRLRAAIDGIRGPR